MFKCSHWEINKAGAASIPRNGWFGIIQTEFDWKDSGTIESGVCDT